MPPAVQHCDVACFLHPVGFEDSIFCKSLRSFHYLLVFECVGTAETKTNYHHNVGGILVVEKILMKEKFKSTNEKL